MQITDNVPANTTFVSATSPAGWTTSAPAVGGTGTITFSKDPVANGETADFTVVVNVDLATLSGTVITNTVDATSDTFDPDTANNTATATTNTVRNGQKVAVDPQGRFVLYTTDPGCGREALYYQALDPSGNPSGAPLALTGCAVLSGDVAGIDLVTDTDGTWISFGGSQGVDGKYVMKIGSAGNILVAPRLVVDATKFGSTPGATALLLKGDTKIRMYLVGVGGTVYRVNINKATLKSKKARSMGIISNSQDALQITQELTSKRFLALERPDNVFKGFGLTKKGLPDGTSWRLCPTTDGGHEVGSVASDGFAALSNNSDGPNDKLYYQVLDGNALPVGSPTVVAGNATNPDIKAADVTNALTGGNRYVVYAADTGIFLQIVDAAGNKVGAPIPLL